MDRRTPARGAVARNAEQRSRPYRNVRTPSGRVTREVEPEEAAVVRRIFEMCRDGKGVHRICRVLNAEGAPVPRAQRDRPAGWVPSSVGAVLRRDCYRGVLTWGKN